MGSKKLYLMMAQHYGHFLTQSELIEPVSLQAAQLGNHFYCYRNTQLEMHLLEGPD